MFTTELDYSNLLNDNDTELSNIDKSDSDDYNDPIDNSDDIINSNSDSDLDTDNSVDDVEEDVIMIFLKDRGISDPTKIQFENDNGEIEDVDFNSLSREEQLTILQELTDPGLSNHETEVINYLRKNNVTFNEVIDYFANQRLQEYLNENPDSIHKQTYSIDEYSDDELYLADLKSKYPSFTDDELVSKLNIAKSDDTLFTKEVEILRESYKEEEDRAKREAEYKEQQEYEALRNNLISAAGSFSEIALDATDPQSDSLVIEDQDRNQILGYLLNQDKDGKSQFVKDIENPDTLIELAWYRINGKNTLSGVTQYWKNILKEERKERASLEKQLEKYKNKEQTTVIKNKETTNSPSSNLDF